MIIIDDNVKLPKEKEPLYMKRARKVFNEYANAYQLVYIRRPTEWSYDNSTGFLRISDAGHDNIGFTLRRMRKITKQLYDRMKQ